MPANGYFVYRPLTNNVLVFWRAFFTDPTKLSEPVKLIEQTRIYPFGKEASAKPMQFPDASRYRQPFPCFPPYKSIRLSRQVSGERSYSAIHNGPFTVDVLFELNNDELLITEGLDRGEISAL
jgi:hypothetical protein